MEAAGVAAAAAAAAPPDQQQQQQQQNLAGAGQPQGNPKVERLSSAVQQQLNLESIKTRALGLYKAINRILDDFDAIARANATPRWQDVLAQFSMVNMELFNIVEDIKKVSKAFVVYPKNVNAENAEILPVMLSSKLLPEMETEDNDKREQLLYGIQSTQVPIQLERIKTRIDMIGTACEVAEKIIAEARKNFGLGSRQGPNLIPTLDKAQAAKIQEQENLLRSAVNFGEGLRIPVDQRQLPSTLPSHLVDVLTFGDGGQNFADTAGVYQKSTPSSNTINAQGALIQGSGSQVGRSVPSPSGVAGTTSFDNASTPPLPYANSPRSSTNIMNTPSPQQQQTQQQQQQLQRHKIMMTQQILAQQQQRQSTPGVLGQSTMSQMHDLPGQSQQKFQPVPGQHQMQYSHQQFQNRQLQAANMQQSMAQNQMSQGNQLRNHLSQLTGTNSSALFSAAQASPNSQMITNMSATMQSQSLMPRMQFGLSGTHPQRSHPSQILNDQMFGIGGAANPASMVGMQQQQQLQQHGTQGGFGGMQGGTAQNLQGIGGNATNLPNAAQNPNFQQQRQQGQQQ